MHCAAEQHGKGSYWRKGSRSFNIGLYCCRRRRGTPAACRNGSGDMPMTVRRALLALTCAPLLLLSPPAQAQPAAGAANPGRDMVASKCFQCHTDSMFRDARQDRRGWEATIYRMI